MSVLWLLSPNTRGRAEMIADEAPLPSLGMVRSRNTRFAQSPLEPPGLARPKRTL
jgi:hypothetical protein